MLVHRNRRGDRLIKPLSLWVLRHALLQRQRWHEAGLNPSIAVNLAVDLFRPADDAVITAHFARAATSIPKLAHLSKLPKAP